MRSTVIDRLLAAVLIAGGLGLTALGAADAGADAPATTVETPAPPQPPMPGRNPPSRTGRRSPTPMRPATCPSRCPTRSLGSPAPSVGAAVR